jgi:hypothetical protein
VVATIVDSRMPNVVKIMISDSAYKRRLCICSVFGLLRGAR